jgi:integrase
MHTPTRILSFVSALKVSPGTRHTYLLTLARGEREASGLLVLKQPEVKDYMRGLDLQLCRHVPRKAPLLREEAVQRVWTHAVQGGNLMLALMVVLGNRHADLLHLKRQDVTILDDKVCIHWRVAKNILKPLHQRRQVVVLPAPLIATLRSILKATGPEDPLFTQPYHKMLDLVKRLCGDEVTTYSLRRTAMELARRRARTIHEMQALFLHRHEGSLRNYLEAPLPDEMASQLHLTGWLPR